MGDFKKLEVWRRAQKLAGTIYQLTNRFPSAERYGLSSQMRRAAVSVTANLAEGCGRQGDLELRRFVRISLGSLSELECELLLAADLNFVESKSCEGIRTDIRFVRRMLQRLHETLPSARTKSTSGHR
jgi:four helix bundle protein